jgi:Fe2+ or Zn2+ uptake regulation protein
MNASEILKTFELPLTKHREGILKCLIKADSPLTIEDFRVNLPSTNESTIYRNLTKLTELGVIKKLNLNSNFSHFELNTAKYTEQGHYHIVCSSCKSVRCIDLKGLDQIFVGQLKKLKYLDIKHKLEFSGICSECKKSR